MRMWSATPHLQNDGGPGTRRGRDRDGAADEVGPLQHALDPEVGSCRRLLRIEAGAVILDEDPDRAVAPGEGDAGCRGGRVADDVGQSLLHHPVAHGLDLRCEAFRSEEHTTEPQSLMRNPY